jgi:hypothetical protein
MLLFTNLFELLYLPAAAEPSIAGVKTLLLDDADKEFPICRPYAMHVFNGVHNMNVGTLTCLVILTFVCYVHDYIAVVKLDMYSLQIFDLKKGEVHLTPGSPLTHDFVTYCLEGKS